ncbi:MAG: hypothetical protein ABIS18_06265 [Actinomycetota bacterium]
MSVAGYQLGIYIVYASVGIGLTIYLAKTLFKHGAVYLEDVFEDKPALAQAINRLLVVGFYMLNIGYTALIMKSDYTDTGIGAIEILSRKLGMLLISLGLIHFLNLTVFHRIRKRAKFVAPIPPPYYPMPPAQPSVKPT